MRVGVASRRRGRLIRSRRGGAIERGEERRQRARIIASRSFDPDRVSVRVEFLGLRKPLVVDEGI